MRNDQHSQEYNTNLSIGAYTVHITWLVVVMETYEMEKGFMGTVDQDVDWPEREEYEEWSEMSLV